MEDLLLRFKTSSFGAKVLMVVIAFVGLVVALGVVLLIFSMVFLNGSGFSMMKTQSNYATDSVGIMQESLLGSGSYKSRSSVPGTPASSGDLPSEKKIIRNGSLSLLVEKAEDSATEIQNIASKYSGFVDNSNIYEVSDGVKSGNVVIRVPEESFYLALADIKKIALKVTSENVGSSDVTAQFVDLEASLKNMKAEEEQYRQIMEKATKIQDILDVSARLSNVRGRIEMTQGQLDYLSRQVTMSTISVSLTAQAEVEVFGIVWRPLTVIKQAFKNLLTDLAGFVDFVVYFLFKLPVLILRLALFLAILWLLWRVGKWTKHRFFTARV